jgi:hypothetical protein
MRSHPFRTLTMTMNGIDITDHRIDRLVYELYGLTEEEIRIVEGT